LGEAVVLAGRGLVGGCGDPVPAWYQFVHPLFYPSNMADGAL